MQWHVPLSLSPGHCWTAGPWASFAAPNAVFHRSSRSAASAGLRHRWIGESSVGMVGSDTQRCERHGSCGVRIEGSWSTLLLRCCGDTPVGAGSPGPLMRQLFVWVPLVVPSQMVGSWGTGLELMGWLAGFAGVLQRWRYEWPANGLLFCVSPSPSG